MPETTPLIKAALNLRVGAGFDVYKHGTWLIATRKKDTPKFSLGKCIFRKNCASVPEERSAIPLQTEQSSASLLVAIIYSTIPARKFKTICLGCHSA